MLNCYIKILNVTFCFPDFSGIWFITFSSCFYFLNVSKVLDDIDVISSVTQKRNVFIYNSLRIYWSLHCNFVKKLQVYGKHIKNIYTVTTCVNSSYYVKGMTLVTTLLNWNFMGSSLFRWVTPSYIVPPSFVIVTSVRTEVLDETVNGYNFLGSVLWTN